MENIFIIGFVGFLFLSAYNHCIQHNYESANGYKFLILVFTWGVVPYTISFFIIENLSGFSGANKKMVFVVEMGLSAVLALSLGWLLSFQRIRKLWSKFKSKITTEKKPARGNSLIKYDFSMFIENEEVIIVTLKNSKVYIGYPLFIDLSEEVSQEQRTIKIRPLRSGYRNQSGEVIYNTDYLSIFDLENKSKQADIIEENLLEIPSLVIFQREIVSYTKYSEKVNHHFGHPGE